MRAVLLAFQWEICNEGWKYKDSQEPEVQMKSHRIKSWWIWIQLCGTSQLIISLLRFQKKKKRKWFILLGTFLKPSTFTAMQMRTSVRKDTPRIWHPKKDLWSYATVLSLARQKRIIHYRFFSTGLELKMAFWWKSVTKN